LLVLPLLLLLLLVVSEPLVLVFVLLVAVPLGDSNESAEGDDDAGLLPVVEPPFCA
jgi:hypothetical protein